MPEVLLKFGLGGCNLTTLNPLLWDAIGKLLELWYPNPLVITSTWEGTHKPTSYHYSADAIDIRKPPGDSPELFSRATKRLPSAFTILDEGDHYHLQTKTRRTTNDPGTNA